MVVHSNIGNASFMISRLYSDMPVVTCLQASPTRQLGYPVVVSVYSKIYLLQSAMYHPLLYLPLLFSYISSDKPTPSNFFLEQQLRTSGPSADWLPFVHPRPAFAKELVVQLPKWWSDRQ